MLASKSNLKTNQEDFQLSSSTFSNDVRILLNDHYLICLLLCYSQFVPSLDTNILLTDFSDLFPSELQETLLNSKDLQLIETISDFYQNRIEFGEKTFSLIVF